MDKLQQLFDQHVREINSKRAIVMAVPCWGETYQYKFQNYMLRSLGNITERHVIVLALPNGSYPIPDEVIASSDKYAIMGLCHSVGLALAKHLNADFHAAAPDVLYCDNFWNNVFRLADEGHKVITQPNLVAHYGSIRPHIEQYRNGNNLTVPAADLCALAMNNLRNSAKASLRHGDSFPDSHMVIHETEDAVTLNSPYQDIIYLDRDVVRQIPTLMYKSFDTQLEQIIPIEYMPYACTASDGLVRVKMMDDNPECERIGMRLDEHQRIMETRFNPFDMSIFERTNIWPLNTKLRITA